MEEVEFIEDTLTEFQEQIDNHLEKRSMVNRV